MSILSPFTFEMPTTIRFGAGVLQELPGILKRMVARRILLVSDAGIAATEILPAVVDLIRGTGVLCESFLEVEPNPKEYNITAGAARARALRADCIIAVGGGSPIDCAKAIAVLTALGGDPRDYEGPGNIPAPVLPLVAIPTTAGSASEVTFSAVLSDSRERIKFSYRDPKIAPAFALADPDLTISLPPVLTAATGMDALTHAIEAYTATVSKPISDALAWQGIELVARHLETAFCDGTNRTARAGMLMGSLLGGLAFSHADVGAVHCLAETLGGRYDLPHGLCNAVILPVMMAYNAAYCSAKYARVATAMGLHFQDEAEGARQAVGAVARLAHDVKLPPFASLGVPVADFPDLAEQAAANSSNTSNPRPMQADDYVTILKKLQKT